MKIVNPGFSSAACRRKIIFGGLLAVMFVSARLPARPFRPVEPIPAGIVDMHCHIAGIGAGRSGCFVSPRQRHNWRFSIYLRSFGVSAKELLKQGDGSVGDRISASLAQSKFVSRAVLLALDGVVDADGNPDFPLINTALVSPWYSFHLSLRQKFAIWRTKNPWNRDVLMKNDLGAPTETFARSGKMFGGRN